MYNQETVQYIMQVLSTHTRQIETDYRLLTDYHKPIIDYVKISTFTSLVPELVFLPGGGHKTVTSTHSIEGWLD